MPTKKNVTEFMIDSLMSHSRVGDVHLEDVKNKTFKELGIDSLDIVDMVLGFENRFEVRIDDDCVEKMGTIAEMIDAGEAIVRASQEA